MRSRYQHILIPVDFSPKNQWAIDVALEMAQVNASRVTLLHVVESLDVVSEDQDIQEFLRNCQQKAEIELERFSQPFSEIGLAVDYRVRIGRRAAEAVSFADEHGVDLIILNSHPIDPENLVQSLASLSYQVSLGANCSVLMVKRPTSD